MQRIIAVSLVAIITSSATDSVAQTFPALSLPPGIHAKIVNEVEMQTLGGRQFWGDVQFFGEYHIQKNVFTGHYRLLDGRDWRHHWGTLEDCRNKLAEIREKKKLPPMSGRGVIVLHGILRSSKSMQTLSQSLREQGYTVFPFEYPSTQISIPDAAEYLDSVIRQLDGIEELHFVAHSMGGLVIRAYFAEHHDPRIRRVVMLGTPNHGAELADRLKPVFVVHALSGPGGRQLVTEGLVQELPIPPVEFAVIAGARGNDSGWNPLIPGDDDGTVTVASTRLMGAADFATVQVLHHGLTSNPEAVQQVRRFLETGRLRAEGDRQPIVIAE